MQRARSVLSAHRVELDRLAQALLAREVIGRAELELIVRGSA